MNWERIQNIDWQLLMIRTYTLLTTVYNAVRTQSVKTGKYLLASLQPDLYVFFKGAKVPVRMTDYTRDVAGAGAIDYYYNRDLKVLSKTSEVTFIPRTLNIESARIMHGDICLYDLTDFFDTTRYAGGQDVPTLNQWIGIWELENGIYLDTGIDFEVEIEFLGGSGEVLPLWRDNEERWNRLTATNSTRLHRQLAPALFTAPCSCPPATDLSGARVTTTFDLSGNVMSRFVGLEGEETTMNEAAVAPVETMPLETLPEN